MAIKKEGEKWKVDIWPWGRKGKRIRKLFATKQEALRFERFALNKAHSEKEWNPSPTDKRKLTELIEIWFKIKGVSLKDGVRRKKCLVDISKSMGNPIANEVTPSNFFDYLTLKRGEGCSDKTLNNHLAYLNAVYNSLNKIEEIAYQSPLSKIEMIKIDEQELSWLTVEQIRHLLETIKNFNTNPHVLLLTKICLATGARWGEAENLKLRNFAAGKVTFVNTKSGKSRSVPIEGSLGNEVRLHLLKYGGFGSSIGAFRRALHVSGISLPKGQAAHVLRHTFASHFVMNGGNILVLQKILGHSSINITMRYAHLSPDHLADALIFNPIREFC